jgi:hypothetical protein
MNRFLLLVCILCGCLIADSVAQNGGGGGGSNPPPPDGGGSNPPPPPPDGGGSNPPPPPPDGGGSNPPPPDGGGSNPPPSPLPDDGSTPSPVAPSTPAPTPNKSVENCAELPREIETYLSIDGLGDPTLVSESDLDALATSFQTTYDSLGQFNCDGLFRRIELVEIQIYDFTPMGTEFVNINFIFKVRYSCRGKACQGSRPAVLFSLLNGFLGRGDKDSKLKDDGSNPPPPQGGGGQKSAIDDGNVFNIWDLRHRQLQNETDVCGDCDTDNPSILSASPRQFVDSYRDAVEALMLPSLSSITNILEVEPRNCSSIPTAFTDSVLFEIEGDPNNITASDLQLLGGTFLSSYNYFSAVQCDGRFLEVDSVEVINQPIYANETTRRQLQVSTNFISSILFYIRGIISGGCSMCGSEYCNTCLSWRTPCIRS